MIQSLALIFIVGLLLGSLFKKIKLPSLIGMLIGGIIIGPYVLNLLDSSILLISADLREIALIIILTRAGLSLNLKDLKEIGRPGVLLSFLPAVFEITGTIIFAPLLLNITYLDAALLGSVIASASPAVIVPKMLDLMKEKRGTNKKIPQMILAGDSIDDIFNIVIFTMLISIKTSNTSSIINQILVLPLSIIFGILLGIIVGLLLYKLFKTINIDTSIKVIILLGVGFLLVSIESLIAHIIPISGLLAILVMGIVILNKDSKVASEVEHSFSNLWKGAQILLFVLIGASVNIKYSTSYLWQTLLLLIIILSIRGIGIFISIIKTNLNTKEKLFVLLSGIPKATVQAAIGGIPLALGIPSGELILSVAVITILFTAPLGAIILDYTSPYLLEKEI